MNVLQSSQNLAQEQETNSTVTTWLDCMTEFSLDPHFDLDTASLLNTLTDDRIYATTLLNSLKLLSAACYKGRILKLPLRRSRDVRKE